jgi:hypothetical protein
VPRSSVGFQCCLKPLLHPRRGDEDAKVRGRLRSPSR